LGLRAKREQWQSDCACVALRWVVVSQLDLSQRGRQAFDEIRPAPW